MVSRWTIPVTRRNLIPKYAPVYNDLRLCRCASCQRVFTNKDDLRHHILLSHTGKKPHACAICGKRYSQLHHLNSHYKIHREPRLQEFSILKHNLRPVSKPASPPSRSVGSFKVSKGYKPFVPEQTFKSFGTLQSFTITQLDRHKHDIKNQKHEKGGTTLPKIDDKGVLHTSRQDSGDESSRRNIDNSNPVTSINEHDTSDMKYGNIPDVRDNGTQTSRSRVIDKKHKPLTDFWVDTKSEWQTHGRKKQPDTNDTIDTLKRHSNSVISEPVSFKTSTGKEPKFYDDPGSTSTGMSGVQLSSEFGHLNRKTKRNKSSSQTKLSDTVSSVTYSIYD